MYVDGDSRLAHAINAIGRQMTRAYPNVGLLLLA
jgi:hypothetical protein